MAQHTWPAASVLTASDMNTYIRDVLEGFATWTTYTPVLVATTNNPILGTTGTAVGRYARLGNTVVWSAEFAVGGSGISAGSGEYSVSIPIAGRAGNQNKGYGFIRGAAGDLVVVVAASQQMVATGLTISHTQGMTTAGHLLYVGGTYEAA